MRALKSTLFACVFYSGTVILLIAALLALPFGSRSLRWVAHRWAQWHRLCCAAILGIRSVVIGTLPQTACIVAIKHQSFFEAIELLLLFDAPVVVLKRELIALPVWGAAARAFGVITVDRSQGAAALREMLRGAQAAKAAGRPIIIFPEGTRTAPGDAPELKSGLYALYKVLNLPIVPIAIDSGRLWPRRGPKCQGIVTWLIEATIPHGLPRADMETRVHTAINALNPSASGEPDR